jgi:hypothetical protein
MVYLTRVPCTLSPPYFISGASPLPREALLEEIPRRDIAGSLLLASWNICEFDSPAYGLRTDEPLFYIAELIDHFDLVAIQEVRDDLAALERLMYLLGWWWKDIITDVTEGVPGNRERMAFLYDSRKVRFGGWPARWSSLPSRWRRMARRRSNPPSSSPERPSSRVSGSTGSGARQGWDE